MEKHYTGQIQNQNLLLNLAAGYQRVESQINVPFNVGKMVIHPPLLYAAAALGDHWLLYSSINNGIVGIVSGGVGISRSDPITVTFQNPISIGGQHSFWVRCLTEASGGAAATLTAKVWVHIEFHEAKISL